MQSDPATSAFLAYCRSGDGPHLGRAFDLVAPELLLVAARLLPRHADAPDLVQRTFLTALQRRRAFDPARRLAPWLFGMLLQHVRHERRRLRRQVDARRLRAAGVESPLDAAIGTEAVEQVRAAVAELQPPYRQVVHLHLVHDLRCHEVAASLGLPFRTVQSQLRRGLAQLRRQLPVPAVAAWCDPLRGLAGVRAAVLRKAAMLAPFGWLSLSWLKLGLGAAAVCAATMIGLVGASGTGSEVVLAAPANETAAARADLSSPVLPVATPVVEHTRIPVQDPEPTCVVRLQVLGTDGVALADAALRAELWSEERGSGSASWQQSKRADRDGWLQCEPPRRAAHNLRLWITAPGHLAVEASVDAPDRETFTFAPLVLPQAARGRIQVRDSAGAGVPRVTVGVQLALPNGFTAPCQRLCTDAEGWTRGSDADDAVELPVGGHRVNLVEVPVSFCTNGEHQVELELRAGDHAIELQQPDPRRVIAGTVVDNDERPLSNAWVALEGGNGAAASLPRVLTDAKGRFALATDGAGPFRLTASTNDGGSRGTVAAVSPGDHEVVARVPLRDGFRLRVVDERDQPVEDFRITCFEVRTRGQIAGPQESRLAGNHPDGHVFVDRVGVGNLRLLVLPESDSGLLPSGYLPIRIEKLGQEVVVRLRAPQSVAVRLVDGDGNAVPGSSVRLIGLLGQRDGSEQRAPALGRGRFHRSSWGGAIEFASAVTDARGVATLPWQPWSEPVLVRAEGPGHVVRELELPGVAPGAAPIELRVAKSARLQVTVRSFERWPAFAVMFTGEPVTATFDQLDFELVLRDAGDGRIEAGPRGEGFAIRPDGSCQCDDVPPGRWQVLLRWNRPMGTGAVVKLVKQPLAEVIATAGKEATTTVDLAPLVPGTIQGRILLDGVPKQARGLTVGDVSRDHRGQPTVGNGAVSWEGFALPEARYRIAGALGGELQVDALIDGQWYPMLSTVRVEPGQEREVDLEFRHLVARIRLLGSDGATPLANRLLRVGSSNDLRTTDADGNVAIDPAPALRLKLDLYQAGLDAALWHSLSWDDPRKSPAWTGAVQLDERPVQTFTLTVPVER